MSKYWLFLSVSLFALGCPSSEKESGLDTGEPIDTNVPDMAFTTAWDGTGVTITITNGSGTFDLGMAETDPASADPWTGEDCLNGYELNDGTILLYCHPLTATGGSFASVTWSQAFDETTETAFNQGLSGVITYAIWDGSNACWTWGHDTSYYTGSGCADIN